MNLDINMIVYYPNIYILEALFLLTTPISGNTIARLARRDSLLFNQGVK